MKKPIVAIALNTMYDYGDPVMSVRYDLAQQTIKKLQDLDSTPDIHIVDRSASQKVVEELRQLDVASFKTIDLTESGGRQKIEVVETCINSGADIVVLMEPEKVDLVKSIPQLVKHLVSSSSDVVVPKRHSLESYPFFQYHGEMMGNKSFEIITGTSLDIWFGPIVMNRKAAQLYVQHDLKPSQIWEVTFCAITQALKQGMNVTSVDIDYEHPQSQTNAENASVEHALKRVNQLYTLTNYVNDVWNS